MIRGRLTFAVYRGGPLCTKRRSHSIRTICPSLSKLLPDTFLLANQAEVIIVNQGRY